MANFFAEKSLLVLTATQTLAAIPTNHRICSLYRLWICLSFFMVCFFFLSFQQTLE